MKYKIADIKNYIKLEHPSLIIQYLIVWIFTVSLFSIPIAVCDPFLPYIFNILIAITVVIDLFAVFIMFNVEKWQRLYILFVGVYSLSLSVVFYLSFFKIAYWVIGIKTPLLFIYTIIIYILILLVGFMLHFKALSAGYYSNTKKKNFKSAGIIAGMSGTGALIGRLLIRSADNQTAMLIFAFVFLFLSYTMILGIHNIYKYYLIKKFEQYVDVYKLSKKKKS